MKTSLIIIFLSVCLTVFAYARDSYLHIKVSDDIEIIKLSDHVFVHVSYAQMGDYGRVPSNGMIFVVGSANRGICSESLTCRLYGRLEVYP
jgi:hypothetical protein